MFLKIGNLIFNTDHIACVVHEADGVTLQYGSSEEATFTGPEAVALLAYFASIAIDVLYRDEAAEQLREQLEQARAVANGPDASYGALDNVARLERLLKESHP